MKSQERYGQSLLKLVLDSTCKANMFSTDPEIEYGLPEEYQGTPYSFEKKLVSGDYLQKLVV